MQYLITTFTDSTGKEHRHITKAKDNQTFTVVEAGSKEEALEIMEQPKGLLQVIPSSFNNNPISKALSKDYRKAESGRLSPKPEKAPIPPRKDSEWIWYF